VLSTTLSVPEAVSQELLSLSRQIAATATGANPSVSVHFITDQVLALALPLKDGMDQRNAAAAGLSMAAKIGIGVGAGVGGLIALILLGWCCLWNKRSRRGHQHVRTTSNSSDITAWTNQVSQRQSEVPTLTGPQSPDFSSKPGQQLTPYRDEATTTPGSTAWTNTDNNYFKTHTPPQHPPHLQQPPPGFLHYTPGPVAYNTGPSATELPGPEIQPTFEAGGRAISPEQFQMNQYHQQQQEQHQSQYVGYGEGGAYAPAPNQPYHPTGPPPGHVSEMGPTTPRPRWMEP